MVGIGQSRIPYYWEQIEFQGSSTHQKGTVLACFHLRGLTLPTVEVALLHTYAPWTRFPRPSQTSRQLHPSRDSHMTCSLLNWTNGVAVPESLVVTVQSLDNDKLWESLSAVSQTAQLTSNTLNSLSQRCLSERSSFTSNKPSHLTTRYHPQPHNNNSTITKDRNPFFRLYWCSRTNKEDTGTNRNGWGQNHRYDVAKSSNIHKHVQLEVPNSDSFFPAPRQ